MARGKTHSDAGCHLERIDVWFAFRRRKRFAFARVLQLLRSCALAVDRSARSESVATARLQNYIDKLGYLTAQIEVDEDFLNHHPGPFRRMSQSRATPMPCGRRPSIAPLTRLGARKASEMVMLT